MSDQAHHASPGDHATGHDPAAELDYRAQAITLGDLLIESAARHGERTALVLAGQRLTYAELLELAIERARSLHALGVRRGDHVGIVMPNCPEFVAGFFGAALLGAVSVPINTRFRTRELGYSIAAADVKVLLTSDIVEDAVSYVSRLHETFPDLADSDPANLSLEKAPELERIVLLGDSESPGLMSRAEFEGLPDRPDAGTIEELRRRVRLRDVALVPFTSGTTAYPRGCMITHEAIVRVWTAVGDRLAITGEDRVFDPLPLFHLGCVGPMIFTFRAGATLVSMTRFEAEEGLDLIEAEDVTWLYTMFPPLTMGLIRAASFPQRDTSRIRAVMNVAPRETLDVIGDAFPSAQNMSGPFGMTEAGGVITCNRALEDADLLETNGPPLPGVEVRVVDPTTDAVLGPGEQGELQIRGYGLLEGYYGDSGQGTEALDPDGWLHSGDLGLMDERGWVTYVARLKEMMKVGGENVAPQEIESHLSKHPAIKLPIVIGVPDERLDEVPAAFIEVAPGKGITAEEVVDYCRGEIASFKLPRYVQFIEEWPMSATKVQRHLLIDLFDAEAAAL